jgi:ppGpp synthetase/RelA/SpoT-type nucleotidyltranferase
MEFNSPKRYSKKYYDKSIILLKTKLSNEKIKENLEIVNFWRSCHIYPLHIFKKRLDNILKNEKELIIISSRLKRTISVIEKTKRTNKGKISTMKLTRMQDIAGCRIILKNLKSLNNFYEKYYLKGNIKHKLVKTYDYIKIPKKDGYRGLHLVYKYHSQKKAKQDYNGLLIEIQLRTKLQHIWATSVEIVGFFTKQKIKIGQGETIWNNFFKYLSIVFEKLENKIQIENKILEKIYNFEKSYNLIEKLENWNFSFQKVDNLIKTKKEKNIEFIVLELDLKKLELSVKTFSKRLEEKALQYYLEIENLIFDNPNYDIVMVGINDIKNLKKAYPNYFLDSKEFIKILKKILKNYIPPQNLLNFQNEKKREY